MITDQERRRMDSIKCMVTQGRSREVSLADKQWVVDLLKREGGTLDPRAAAAAAREGVDISGLNTQAHSPGITAL